MSFSRGSGGADGGPCDLRTFSSTRPLFLSTQKKKKKRSPCFLQGERRQRNWLPPPPTPFFFSLSLFFRFGLLFFFVKKEGVSFAYISESWEKSRGAKGESESGTRS